MKHLEKLLSFWPILLALIGVLITAVRADTQIQQNNTEITQQGASISVLNAEHSEELAKVSALEQKTEDTNETVHRIEDRLNRMH